MMKNAVFPLLSAEKSMLSSDIRFLQKSDSKTDSLLLRERRMVSFTCAGVESEKILYSFFAVHEKLISPIFSNRLSISASLFSACSSAAFKNSATCRKRFPAEFQSARFIIRIASSSAVRRCFSTSVQKECFSFSSVITL